MEKEWVVFEQALTSEIGKELAALFVRSLYTKSGGSTQHAERIYAAVGTVWTPVLLHWRDWIIRKATHTPLLIMRDAKPLTVLPISNQWKRIWLNRENCGIRDELAETGSTKDQLLEDYLEENLLKEPFTWVDSGCWGSIVLEMHMFLGLQFQPLFFFSHNPHIPGFLNDLGLSDEEGEILNDSLECCFPNIVTRPAIFQNCGGEITPHYHSMDRLSRLFGESVLKGVEKSLHLPLPSAHASVKVLLSLSKEAHGGVFTGILPSHSPTWSQGKTFLEAWPSHLHWT